MSNKFQSDRRRFLRQMGMGAGACFFNPILSGIYNEAFAQTATATPQKLILFYMNGQPRYLGGGQDGLFLPSSSRFDIDIENTTSLSHVPNIQLLDSEWPRYMSQWQPFMSQARILDGLHYTAKAAPGNTKHGMMYAGLNGYSGRAEDLEIPAAATIDQIIAGGPSGDGMAHKSILVGLKQSDFGWQRTFSSNVEACFASGLNTPVPFTGRTAALESKLFGDDFNVNVASSATTDSTKARRKRIMDTLNKDVDRLNKRLANDEKVRLENYLAAVETYDTRRDALETGSSSCDIPTPTTLGEGSTAEDELMGLVDGATLAMKCGLTNVVAIASGIQGGHATDISFQNNVDSKLDERWFEASRVPVSSASFYNGDFYYHTSNADWDEGNRQLVNFYSGLMVRMLENISGQRGVMPANTTAILLSDRGMVHNESGHHGANGNSQRNPVFMLTSNPALQGGGQYYRYQGTNNATGADRMSFSAFYMTFAKAFGVELDQLGDWTYGPIDGVLS